ncbi:MAG: toxic anion resistance protein [Lachnospirales bacterium]
MNENDFNISAPATPTLTLSPATNLNEDLAPSQSETEVKAKTDKEMTDFDKLDSNEKAQVMEFSKQINLSDSQQVLQYGSAAQNKVSNFSDNILKAITSKGDRSEISNDLVQLTKEIKSLESNSQEEDAKGFKKLFQIFKPVEEKLETYQIKYNSIAKNIDVITETLEEHQRTLMKDVHLLDDMYESNKVYFKELTMYILAGEEKLENYKNIDLKEQRDKATESGDQLETQKLNDMLNMSNRFEKKLHDLKLSRTVSLQTAPQIRMIQNNDVQLIEKIQSSVLNAIPLWKNNIVITLTMMNSNKAIESQKKVTDMTNTLLKKNSEMLKTGSIEVAKLNEESIVSIDTLQKTNQDLIDTISEVLVIQENGKIQRAEATKELVRLEDELKVSILNAAKAQSDNNLSQQ